MKAKRRMRQTILTCEFPEILLEMKTLRANSEHLENATSASICEKFPPPPPTPVTPTSRRRCRHLSPQIRPQRALSSRFSRNRAPGSEDAQVPWFKSFSPELQGRPVADGSTIRTWKRVFDILLVLLILPFIAIFAAIVYCWIQAVSPGNVLFRQTRIGRGGKPFTIYKFRSMKLRAPTNIHEDHIEHLIKSNMPMTKLDVMGDSRLIKGGCLIRTSGLDELPQFINVLRGEMSLVGPRPCLPKEFELYEESQRNRFAVQPGLTGQWQVNRTGTTTFSEMVKMDDDYVDNLSPLRDVQIILKTPFALLRQMKACATAHGAIKSPSPARSSRPLSQPAFVLSMSTTQKLSD